MSKHEQIDTIYDDRFYCPKDKSLNTRTGLPYFPSVTTILSYLRLEHNLLEWIANRGSYGAYRRYLSHRANIGSFVHNMIDSSVNKLEKFPFEDLKSRIEFEYPENDDQLFLYGALRGWVNFLRDEEPIIIESEKSFHFEDYAGTRDLVCRLKSDKYKHEWLIDNKTSKQSNEHHFIQVSAYQKARGCKRGGVLVLGNKTEKKYTLTKIPVKKFDHYIAKFNWAKEGFYLDNPEATPKMIVPFDFKTDVKHVKLNG